MTAEISSMSRIDQLADEYAQRALDAAIVDPINQERAAKATPEEIADCHQRFFERERKSAMKLLTYAETRDYPNLCNALGKHNPRWRELFCKYAGVQSLPRTDRDIGAFLREWIGSDEVSRQESERKAQLEREESERLRKIAEQKRAECLTQQFRFRGSIVTFDQMINSISGMGASYEMAKRGAFPVVHLFYGETENERLLTYLEFRKAEQIAVIRERIPERAKV